MTTDTKGPRISDLDSVAVGETPTARLTESVLRGVCTRDGVGVQEALTVVAGHTLSDEWTVYRWLRGHRSPGSRTLRALSNLASDVGVEVAA